MGDRGNIIVKDPYSDGCVYLYTHWTGSELPEVLGKALSRNERWDDAPYLTRIIFCEMVRGDEAGATGYGISPSMGDGGTDIVVDVKNQTVDYNGDVESFEAFAQRYGGL